MDRISKKGPLLPILWIHVLKRKTEMMLQLLNQPDVEMSQNIWLTLTHFSVYHGVLQHFKSQDPCHDGWWCDQLNYVIGVYLRHQKLIFDDALMTQKYKMTCPFKFICRGDSLVKVSISYHFAALEIHMWSSLAKIFR